jgi:FKBP-type peptidyl-prolyl cis-trans isomerase SlyD
MKIEKDSVVTVRYKLSDAKGKLIEEARQPMVYLHGGYGNTLPKIEAALDGRMPGYQISLLLQAEDAFGMRDEALVRTLPRDRLPAGTKVGAQLRAKGPDSEEPVVYTVKEIRKDGALLDGNHPMAGRELRFGLTVVSVRPGTEEEIAHRHVHGEHGHHH